MAGRDAPPMVGGSSGMRDADDSKNLPQPPVAAAESRLPRPPTASDERHHRVLSFSKGLHPLPEDPTVHHGWRGGLWRAQLSHCDTTLQMRCLPRPNARTAWPRLWIIFARQLHILERLSCYTQELVSFAFGPSASHRPAFMHCNDLYSTRLTPHTHCRIWLY